LVDPAGPLDADGLAAQADGDLIGAYLVLDAGALLPAVLRDPVAAGEGDAHVAAALGGLYQGGVLRTAHGDVVGDGRPVGAAAVRLADAVGDDHAGAGVGATHSLAQLGGGGAVAGADDVTHGSASVRGCNSNSTVRENGSARGPAAPPPIGDRPSARGRTPARCRWPGSGAPGARRARAIRGRSGRGRRCPVAGGGSGGGRGWGSGHR